MNSIQYEENHRGHLVRTGQLRNDRCFFVYITCVDKFALSAKECKMLQHFGSVQQSEQAIKKHQRLSWEIFWAEVLQNFDDE